MGKSKFGQIVALGAVVGAGAWVYKKYDTIKSMYHKVSLFKGERYEYDIFEGEAIAAMFSGVMIDLSDVEFADDEVYLDIYALCSGVKVFIPKDVEIVLEGTNNASGIQVDQDEDTPKTKTLYINYNATASGIQITDNVDDSCCCCGDDECCDDESCDDPSCCCNDDDEDVNEEENVDTNEEKSTKEEVKEEVKEEEVVKEIKEEDSIDVFEAPEDLDDDFFE